MRLCRAYEPIMWIWTSRLGRCCVPSAGERLIILPSVRLGSPNWVTVPWERQGKEQFSTLGIPTVEMEPWGRGVCGRCRKSFCTNQRSPKPAGGVRSLGIMSGTPLEVVCCTSPVRCTRHRDIGQNAAFAKPLVYLGVGRPHLISRPDFGEEGPRTLAKMCAKTS